MYLKDQRKWYYDLELLPVGWRDAIYDFLVERMKRLAFITLKKEIADYKVCSAFIREKQPEFEQPFCEEEVIKRFKVWLLGKGRKIIMPHYMKSIGRKIYHEIAPIQYLRKIIRFLQPEDKRSETEKDVWEIDKLGFPVRMNPISPVKTIRFTGISQEQMKVEVKQACAVMLKYLSANYVTSLIRAAKNLAKYLMEHFPEMTSFTQLNRKKMEEYLIFYQLNHPEKKTKRTELSCLKSILLIIGKITEYDLSALLFRRDQPGTPSILYKVYSDSEVKRLNRIISKLNVQVARAMILHQILGTRISDTLTLEKDCIRIENGKEMIIIRQPKADVYEKPINKETGDLIRAAIAYADLHYPESKYIFASEKDWRKPYNYSTLKHKLTALILENDVRDDQGELFGVGTHLFRHRYGMKLAEMGLDDYSISRLLGHKGVRSVVNYRRVSGKIMAEKLAGIQKDMNEELKNLMLRWPENDYRQIETND